MTQRQPLMPKATAVWLVENTALSFEQIAAFCGLHELEIAAIADGEVAIGMVGLDPIANAQLTKEEIDRCQDDPDARLKLAVQDIPQPLLRTKGPRYTPVTRRADKPDAIAYLLKHHPELTDTAISRLIGTTKPTIGNVRNRSHWNSQNIKARHPVMLGLCSQADMEEALTKAAIIAARNKSPEDDEEAGPGPDSGIPPIEEGDHGPVPADEISADAGAESTPDFDVVEPRG